MKWRWLSPISDYEYRFLEWDTLESAMEEMGLDRLYFILAAQSPFKPENAPAPPAERLRLLRLALAGQTHYEIDEQAREEWLRKEVPRIRNAVRKYRGILYFQDESNVSLTAFLGKTWAPRGKTPKLTVSTY